jgi:predicted DNA-binding transcriptional regulator AlpA
MQKLDRLITTKEAADYLNLSPASLIRYRWQGAGPRFVRPGGGRAVRYSISDLQAWVSSNTVGAGPSVRP